MLRLVTLLVFCSAAISGNADDVVDVDEGYDELIIDQLEDPGVGPNVTTGDEKAEESEAVTDGEKTDVIAERETGKKNEEEEIGLENEEEKTGVENDDKDAVKIEDTPVPAPQAKSENKDIPDQAAKPEDLKKDIANPAIEPKKEKEETKAAAEKEGDDTEAGKKTFSDLCTEEKFAAVASYIWSGLTGKVKNTLGCLFGSDEEKEGEETKNADEKPDEKKDVVPEPKPLQDPIDKKENNA